MIANISESPIAADEYILYYILMYICMCMSKKHIPLRAVEAITSI